MKKIALLFAWGTAAVLTITANTLVVMSLLNHGNLQFLFPGRQVAMSSSQDAASADVLGLETSIGADDARPAIVSNFLKREGKELTPLQPYDEWGRRLVAIADKYGLDFRLLPAIAMQESNLCKAIPEGTYNCTGYGITGSSTLGFQSYQQSFEATAASLKKSYIDKGLTNPLDIMRKYTPPSDGSWQDSVNQWLAEMKYDDHAKGLDLKTNADLTEYATPPSTSSAAPALSTVPAAQ